MPDLTLENLLSDKKNLEQVLDHLRDGIIAHDRNRIILYFNRVAEEITGYSRNEVLGRDCHQAFGSPLCGGQCSFCGQAPGTWTPVSYPINIITKNGKPCQIEMSVVGMTDGAGSLAGVLATFRDVTSLAGLKLWAEKTTGFAGIIGRTPQMVQIFREIQRIAETDYPVLVTGETGTGKELVAAAIHSESRRRTYPFVPVNCGALPGGIVESELFGHVRGAFSGAFRDKKGRFELAHGGTIFLDEVGELSKDIQVKLLRVLEQGTFERVGGESTIAVNVRVICATNRDLKKEITKKNFREDLYYRINVVPIHLPPLRNRKDDLPLLLNHFLEQARKQGQKTARFAPETISRLRQYPWPGNVRELQNAIHFALARCSGDEVGPEDLPPEVQGGKGISTSRGPAPKLNWAMIKTALEQCGGNKVKAARLLGVGRATLYRFLASQDTPLS
ncbi:MAG: sigma-54 interaction domain-containing protein [Thermodesulfobacteriota bacterium]